MMIQAPLLRVLVVLPVLLASAGRGTAAGQETAARETAPVTAFDGTAVEPGSTSYTLTTFANGHTVFKTDYRRTVSRLTLEGREQLLIVDSSTPIIGEGFITEETAGLLRMVDSTWADAATLIPIRRVVHSGLQDVELTFRADSILGRATTNGVERPLAFDSEGVVFTSGGLLEVGLGTLSLSAADTVRLRSFDPYTGSGSLVEFAVQEVEQLETPAGVREAYPLALVVPPDSAASGGASAPQAEWTVWIEREPPHRMVRTRVVTPIQEETMIATVELAEP